MGWLRVVSHSQCILVWAVGRHDQCRQRVWETLLNNLLQISHLFLQLLNPLEIFRLILGLLGYLVGFQRCHFLLQPWDFRFSRSQHLWDVCQLFVSFFMLVTCLHQWSDFFLTLHMNTHKEREKNKWHSARLLTSTNAWPDHCRYIVKTARINTRLVHMTMICMYGMNRIHTSSATPRRAIIM